MYCMLQQSIPSYVQEKDDVFKYIALELCETTLHEVYVHSWYWYISVVTCDLFQYVEMQDDYERRISYKSILKQAMEGLAHLHQLGIGLFKYIGNLK